MGFKYLFNIPAELTYLNTAGNGLLPNKTVNWRLEREKCFYEPNSQLRDQQQILIEETRSALASFFKTKSSQVFCTPSFSFGFNILLDRLSKNYSFLIIQDDYPSLNYPIINRRLKHNYVEISDKLEEDLFEKVALYKPDVLLLSIVQYINGLKIDLRVINRLKDVFPDLLIIGDGTQFFGTEQFNFDDSGFDAVGSSGYKWLLGGFGNGFMILNERLQSILLHEAGKFKAPVEEMWAGKSKLQTFFEPGHQDTLAHGTLKVSLSLIEELGLNAIEEHIAKLTAFAYNQLKDRELLLPLVANREIRSALINIQISPNLYPKLVDQGIRCFPRGTGIRIGLHLYNTEQDIQYMLDVIDNLK